MSKRRIYRLKKFQERELKRADKDDKIVVPSYKKAMRAAKAKTQKRKVQKATKTNPYTSNEIAIMQHASRLPSAALQGAVYKKYGLTNKIRKNTETAASEKPFLFNVTRAMQKAQTFGLADPKKQLEKAVGKIDTKKADKSAWGKAGDIVGTGLGYMTGAGLSEGTIAAGLTKSAGKKVFSGTAKRLITADTKKAVGRELRTATGKKVLPKAKKFAARRAADVIAGTSINVPYAAQESKNKKEFVENLAANTAADVAFGGAFDAAAKGLKVAGEKSAARAAEKSIKTNPKNKADMVVDEIEAVKHTGKWRQKTPEMKQADIVKKEFARKSQEGKILPTSKGQNIRTRVLKKASEETEPVTKKKVLPGKTLSASGKRALDYQTGHMPTTLGRAHNIAEKEEIPGDVYKHPEKYFQMDQKTDQESVAALKKIKNDPDAKVTIYRASPKDEFNDGDWVTLSPTYAKTHADRAGTKVYSKTVKAKDIQFAGDDVNEFGYFPSEIKKYNASAKKLKYLPKASGDSSYIKKNTVSLGMDDGLKIKKAPQMPDTNAPSYTSETESTSTFGHILPKYSAEVNRLDSERALSKAAKNNSGKWAEETEKLKKADPNYAEFENGLAEKYGDNISTDRQLSDATIYSITDKGVSNGKDIQRNIEAATYRHPEAREELRRVIEEPLYKSKKEYTNDVIEKTDDMYDTVVKKLGIQKGSKESAAVQWYGEGEKLMLDKKGNPIPYRDGDNIKFRMIKYTEDDLKRDFNYRMKNGRLAWKNIIEAEKWFRKQYDSYVDRINTSMKKIYPNVEENVAKLKEKLSATTDSEKQKKIRQQIEDEIVGKRLQKRKDYFRHFQEQPNLIGIDNILNSATNIDPRLVGVSEYTQPKSKFTGFMQRRTGENDYTADAIGGMLEYIPQAEYKIHIEPNIQNIRSVVKELQENTIQSRNANDFIEILQRQANDLAGKTNELDRTFDKFWGMKGRKYINALNTISTRMRSNAIMGNINSILAQVFNFPNVVGYMKNPEYITRGIADALNAATDPKGEYAALMKKSGFLQERYLDRHIRRFDRGVLNNINRFFVWSMEAGDKAVSDAAWFGFYRKALAKSMKGEKAISYADEFTRKSVAGRGIAEMPLSQKARLTKLFAPFQVEVRNALNVMLDMLKTKDAIGLAGVFATSYIMNQALYMITGRRVSYDPINVIKQGVVDYKTGEKSGKKAAESIGIGLFGETLNNIPGGAYIAQMIQDYTNIDSYTWQELFGDNDPSRFGTGNIAIQTLAKPIGQLITGQNVDLLKPATSLLPKYGGKQIEKTVRGLQDMAVLPRANINLDGAKIKKQDFPASYNTTGKIRFAMDPSAKNYILAPTFSSWSTEEGKKYINKDEKPLSNKATAVMENVATKDNAVSMEKLVRKLPKAKEKHVSDARELIMDSNFTAKEKNKLGKLIDSQTKVDYTNKTSFEISQLHKDSRKKIKKMQKAGISSSTALTVYNNCLKAEKKKAWPKDTYLAKSWFMKGVIDGTTPGMSSAKRRHLYELYQVSEKVW